LYAYGVESLEQVVQNGDNALPFVAEHVVKVADIAENYGHISLVFSQVDLSFIIDSVSHELW